jgi:hypothetical protein
MAGLLQRSDQRAANESAPANDSDHADLGPAL